MIDLISSGYLIRRKKTFVFSLKLRVDKFRQLPLGLYILCLWKSYCRFTLLYASAIFSVDGETYQLGGK